MTRLIGTVVAAVLVATGCTKGNKEENVGPPPDTGGGKGLPAMKPPEEGGGNQGKVPSPYKKR